MSSATSSATPAFSSIGGTADSMFGVVYSTLELPVKAKTFHGNHSASSTYIKFPACSCILHAHPPCVHAGPHAINYMETLFYFVLRSSGPLRCHNPHHVAAPLALRHDRTETRTSPRISFWATTSSSLFSASFLPTRTFILCSPCPEISD